MSWNPMMRASWRPTLCRLAFGAGLAAVLAAVLWSTGEAAPAPDDDAPWCGIWDCDCDPTFDEKKVQPAFEQSCLQSIEVTAGSSTDGCCVFPTVRHCKEPKQCKFKDIKVKVTPENACTIRVTDGDTTGLPIEITDLTTFEPQPASVACAKDSNDAFKIEVRVDLGWKVVFTLSYHCSQCDALKPPTED